LTPGFGGSVKKCYWKVWIDFNMDGDFTDANEYIASGDGASQVSGILTMPYTLWNGTATMRIICKLGSPPQSPCEVYPYGETEDYCVTVLGGDLIGTDIIESREASDFEATELSIETPKSENRSYGLEVYPNPASDFINIDHEDIDMVKSISIYNTTGKLITDIRDINEKRFAIDHLQNGMYILTTIYTDGEVGTSKFVVQK